MLIIHTLPIPGERATLFFSLVPQETFDLYYNCPAHSSEFPLGLRMNSTNGIETQLRRALEILRYHGRDSQKQQIIPLRVSTRVQKKLELQKKKVGTKGI